MKINKIVKSCVLMSIGFATCLVLTSQNSLATKPNLSDTQVQGTAVPHVDFSLSKAGDTDFSTYVPTGQIADKIYSIVDGVAYELDSTTLERIDIPLDPITHEPLSKTPNVIEPSAVPKITPIPETAVESKDISAVATAPDPLLPNMGIYTEYD